MQSFVYPHHHARDRCFLWYYICFYNTQSLRVLRRTQTHWSHWNIGRVLVPKMYNRSWLLAPSEWLGEQKYSKQREVMINKKRGRVCIWHFRPRHEQFNYFLDGQNGWRDDKLASWFKDSLVLWLVGYMDECLWEKLLIPIHGVPAPLNC